jgi:methyl-accepting chemotaxis protein
MRSSIIIAVITLLVVALISGFIARALLKQLGGEPDYAAEIVNRIANGDLTVRSAQARRHHQPAGGDERHGRQPVARGDRGERRRRSAGLGLGRSQRHRAIAVAGASEQAAAAEESSAAIEQMSASIAQNTENAKVTDGMAGKAAQEAGEGGEAVRSTVAAMRRSPRKSASSTISPTRPTCWR